MEVTRGKPSITKIPAAFARRIDATARSAASSISTPTAPASAQSEILVHNAGIKSGFRADHTGPIAHFPLCLANQRLDQLHIADAWKTRRHQLIAQSVLRSRAGRNNHVAPLLSGVIGACGADPDNISCAEQNQLLKANCRACRPNTVGSDRKTVSVLYPSIYDILPSRGHLLIGVKMLCDLKRPSGIPRTRSHPPKQCLASASKPETALPHYS